MQLKMFTEAAQTKASADTPRSPTHLSTALRQHSASIDTALQGIFKSTQEETRLQQARHIMAGAIDSLSDEELEVYLAEFQHLLEEWLDAFECELFDGQTLKQVLGQA